MKRIKYNKVILIAYNEQGASVRFIGKNKKDAYEKFLSLYDKKDFYLEYYNEFGVEI